MSIEGACSTKLRTLGSYMKKAHMRAVIESCTATIPKTFLRKPCRIAASHASTVGTCAKSVTCPLPPSSAHSVCATGKNDIRKAFSLD